MSAVDVSLFFSAVLVHWNLIGTVTEVFMMWGRGVGGGWSQFGSDGITRIRKG